MKNLRKEDRLFFSAEEAARDFSLFPPRKDGESSCIRGLISNNAIKKTLARLRNMDIDAYVRETVLPAEMPRRPSAKEVVRAFSATILKEEADGPYYEALIELEFSNPPDTIREVGIIAQDRAQQNGVWMPWHHVRAAKAAENYAKRSIPIVTLMDTPGANAEDEANRNNQAHSISRLIAQMCIVGVPTLGIILGLGYSGGAIPLAASNIILSVRDGVFNTIQPRALASIARKYNLSWQECARHVGISAFELYKQGNIDGIIDYSPNDKGKDTLENFRLAIVSGIESIETMALRMAQENEDLLTHYHQKLERFLRPSRTQKALNASVSMAGKTTPTEFTNIFGVAYQYSRYLGIRKRIKSTTIKKYGRLAEQEIPRGDHRDRIAKEQRRRFFAWLQDPDPIAYDDKLVKVWEHFLEKKSQLHTERGLFTQMVFGNPGKNYEDAVNHLVLEIGFYLYNLWKNSARYNFKTLMQYLQSYEDNICLLRTADLLYPETLHELLSSRGQPHLTFLRQNLSDEYRSLVRGKESEPKARRDLQARLVLDINELIYEGFFDREEFLSGITAGIEARHLHGRDDQKIRRNRLLLQDAFPNLFAHLREGHAAVDAPVTLLDIFKIEELREKFTAECQQLIAFDIFYNHIIANLEELAQETKQSQALSAEFIDNLLTAAQPAVSAALPVPGLEGEQRRQQVERDFQEWIGRFPRRPQAEAFLRSVEEWKQNAFPHLSDTLFVIITFLFNHLIPHRISCLQTGKKFVGSIRPRKIGNRKDFWNQLAMAYRDLLIQKTLRRVKKEIPLDPKAFIDAFFDAFTPLKEDYLSSDPLHFPGFRLAIENALHNDVTPCGLITGIGMFRGTNGPIKIGTAISNIHFQAGSFDMASAEKLCALLVECARQRLPVICFISSGGMQTKEGAGALFSMAAVNDRATRFIRDHDLPIVVFGFGDCTGGAQASFVTHPLVQTYYFSGANVPFAGQIVVRSHLSSDATIANYLSVQPGSMQGLVKHALCANLDTWLREIDPDVPIAQEEVQEVVTRIMAGRFSASGRQTSQEDMGGADLLVRKIKRVLIHARGCTAVKLVRVARDRGIEIALAQSDPDMESVAGEMLSGRNQLICIGGYTPDESYLNGLSVVRVAEQTNADALHPGIGFLSENSQFAALCRNHKINFIGPPVSSMETMGNKSNAISAAVQIGVPVVPGSHGILTSAARAERVAQQIGYPVLIKAVHGGGGKGIKLVHRAQELNEIFHLVSEEARNAFGNGDVYLEKFVTSLRHVEVQILRDVHGNIVVPGFRDCTVQRDKQKVIEESDVSTVDQKTLQKLAQYSRDIAAHIGYVGAGTVEFIYDLQDNRAYFMEMNTRLQIEHPVTEAVSGISIVGAQFDIAAGGSIENVQVGATGCAIEARVTAEEAFVGEDGEIRFRPCPGQVEKCAFPPDENIETIVAVAAGKTVTPYYDSMVAQIIARGANRAEAINRLAAALDRSTLTGISTNIPLLQIILADDVFRSGKYDTNYLPQLLSRIDTRGLLAAMSADPAKSSTIDLDTLRIPGGNELKVLSPMTGIFYQRLAPTEPPYVAVGDRVDTQQVLCQIEAMKIFSSLNLTSFNKGEQILYPEDQAYRIKRVQQPDGRQVNAGDLLFVIEPCNARD